MTMRKRASPLIIFAYASPARSSGTVSIIGLTPERTLKSSVSSESRAVPDAWRLAPLVLLAPLAGEVDPELAGAFPAARVAATPQGWLRQWDADGLVRPGPWPDAERIAEVIDSAHYRARAPASVCWATRTYRRVQSAQLFRLERPRMEHERAGPVMFRRLMFRARSSG